MKTTELFTGRIVRSSPKAAFEAWTRAELVRQWWGPPPFTCPKAEIDLRVDGQYRIANQNPNGEVIWISGIFLEVKPPSALRYTWSLSTDPDCVSLVAVEFLPHPDGTEIRLRHERFTSVPIRDQHLDGWHGCLEKLGSYLQDLPSAAPAGSR